MSYTWPGINMGNTDYPSVIDALGEQVEALAAGIIVNEQNINDLDFNKVNTSAIVNNDTVGGVAVPASAEIVKTHGAEIDALNTSIGALTVETGKNLVSSALKTVIKSVVEMPDGFTWTGNAISIYKSGDGVITTSIDAANFAYTGGVTYYVSTTGSDSNDGLTSATPLAKISTARAKADVGTIIVAAGFYTDINGFNQVTNQNKNISIKAATGANVIISNMRNLTYTKTAGYTNVYEVSRTSVAGVWDSEVLDAIGDYTKLTPVASIALCDATAGTYYYATPMLYIHTPNSRAADAEIKVSLDINNFYNLGNYTTYFENIKLYGGKKGCAYVAAGTSTDNPMFVAKNCEFKYSAAGNGGLILEGADGIFENCIASRNYQDGFNYHLNATRICQVIEIGCTGRCNGIGRGENSDNGSTIHEGGKIIRVNGTYHNNEGPNVHDINSGTQSWNVGCESYDSDATIPTIRANYMISDLGEMWLDTCTESASDYSTRVEATAKMYLRSCTMLEGLPNIIGNIYGY